MRRHTPPKLCVTGMSAISSSNGSPLLGNIVRACCMQDYTLLRDGHEETSVFDLEAQRKSSASIRRLLGLAKEETGVRTPCILFETTLCYTT